MKVSVPSRGILFPNIYKHIWFLKDLKTVSVPSRGILFPNSFIIDGYSTNVTVSVPSRGILFPNISALNILTVISSVSVPSRGILFPNRFHIWCQIFFKIMFPSPLGVSYFQILPARARYFTGFSDSFAWQIIFLYIFLISNIHNRLQMQYLCGARQNYLFF